MTRQILRFEPNKPETVTLAYSDGVHVRGFYGHQVRYTLQDNRTMYVDQEPNQALELLKPRAGETFRIIRRSEPGRLAWWEVERVAKGGDATANGSTTHRPVTPAARNQAQEPTARPVPPVTPSELPERPRIAAQTPNPPIVRENPPRIPPQTVGNQPPPIRGTGTDGPAPRLTPRAVPLKPTYREALHACVVMVQEVLEATGEQWSDQSRQAMVSTLMIQAGREGAVRFGVSGRGGE